MIKNVLIGLISLIIFNELSAHAETGRHSPHYRQTRMHFKELHSDVQGALHEAMDNSTEHIAESVSDNMQEIGGNIAHTGFQAVVKGTKVIGAAIHNLITGKTSNTNKNRPYNIDYGFELP